MGSRGLGGRPSVAMRVQLASAETADSLADYLRRCDCSVSRLDPFTVGASGPRGHVSQRLELEGRLRVWRVMYPDEQFLVLT